MSRFMLDMKFFVLSAPAKLSRLQTSARMTVEWTVDLSVTQHDKATALTASPDGTLLVAAMFNSKANVSDLTFRSADRSTQRTLTLDDQCASITTMRFNTQGSLVCAGTKNGTVLLIDPVTPKVARKWEVASEEPGNSGPITSVQFSQDDEYLFVACDNKITQWQNTTLTRTLTCPLPVESAQTFSLDALTKYIAICRFLALSFFFFFSFSPQTSTSHEHTAC
eukprot:m.210615 g.210615  ORF g.210615 m.210615 type:complete len:223 (+) comp15052_c0_seq9:183-851(+)